MPVKIIPPSVTIGGWLQQFADEPSVDQEFKDGAENQIKLTNTSFSSGSVVKPNEFLCMRILCHKFRTIEALGIMMTDDPNGKYMGYVSPENQSAGRFIFDTQRHLWEPYLEELKLRSAYDEYLKTTATPPGMPRSDGMKSPPQPQPYRPSEECGLFYEPLHWQCSGLETHDNQKPSEEELERTSSITKPGPGREPITIAGPRAVNRPVTPLKIKDHWKAAQDTPMDGLSSTPEMVSYYPARGGTSNTPAVDESYINTALLLLLKSILRIDVQFGSMEWRANRLAFHLTEKIGTKKTATGEEITELRNLMEARVDGYLCRRSDPFKKANTDALAIIEAKRYVRSSAQFTIRRQEGAEMACWISEADDSRSGLLRTSSTGKKRRLMISQNRHEIYIIVGEYGASFEDHIRPSTSTVKPGSSNMGTSAGAGSSASTPYRRDIELLAGSPSYLNRIESRSLIVEVPKKKPDERNSTQPEPETIQSPGTQWNPEAGDFLIMNEFGPFLVNEASHMDLFIRRLIPLLLELRGPRDSFTPEPLSANFLHQPDLSSTLKKARSWESETEKSTQHCIKPTAKLKWGDKQPATQGNLY